MTLSLFVSAPAFAQMAVPPPPPPSVTVPTTTTGVPPTPAPANPGLPTPPTSPSTPSTQGLPAQVTSELRPAAIPTPTQVAQTQQLLTANGFYHGPIDGQLNATTLSALRAFQVSARLPVTGTFDTQTTDVLNQLAPVTIGAPTPTAPGTAATTATTSTPATTTTINQTGNGAVTQPTTRVGATSSARSTEQFPLSVPPPTPPFPESPLFIQP
jgi:hypothetical protein